MTDSPHSCIYVVYIYNKKQIKYTTVETIPISKRKFTERGQIDSPSIHTHDSSISWLGTGTPMNKNVGFKPFFYIRETYNRTNRVVIKNAFILSIMHN
jgi:hypothetical protein